MTSVKGDDELSWTIPVAIVIPPVTPTAAIDDSSDEVIISDTFIFAKDERVEPGKGDEASGLLDVSLSV